MNLNLKQTVLILLCATSCALAQEIPQGFQSQILAYAPELDADGDGAISREEVLKAYPSLPPRMQRAVKKRAPDLFEGSDDDTQEASASTDTGFRFSRPAGAPEVAREKGYNCLFLGHSYFVPIVSRIPLHAEALGLTQHQQFLVSNGGPKGSPGALWKNEQKSAPAKALLERGNVELLAMTAHNVGSTVEDYSRWIDLALKHNPKTVFVIQTPWAQKKEKTFTQYQADIEEGVQKTSLFISGLRKKYPSTVIVNVPQNKWMLEVWKLKNAGKLPEITELIAENKQSAEKALFRDRHGHGGQLAVQDGVLLWLRVMYGTDLNRYDVATMTEYDTKALAQNIIDADPYTKMP